MPRFAPEAPYTGDNPLELCLPHNDETFCAFARAIRPVGKNNSTPFIEQAAAHDDALD